jgi:hypothetical protein
MPWNVEMHLRHPDATCSVSAEELSLKSKRKPGVGERDINPKVDVLALILRKCG